MNWLLIALGIPVWIYGMFCESEATGGIAILAGAALIAWPIYN